MKSKINKEKILELTTLVIGILTFAFTMTYVITNEFWAYCIEIILLFPFWSLITTLIVIKVRKRKDDKK